ncbi:hypothetical protein U1Q18_051638 [Sarracenia purpurea var. burkii]
MLLELSHSPAIETVYLHAPAAAPARDQEQPRACPVPEPCPPPTSTVSSGSSSSSTLTARERALGTRMPLPLPRRVTDYLDQRQFPPMCHHHLPALRRYIIDDIDTGFGASMLHNAWTLGISAQRNEMWLLRDPDPRFGYTRESNCTSSFHCVFHRAQLCLEHEVADEGVRPDDQTVRVRDYFELWRPEFGGHPHQKMPQRDVGAARDARGGIRHQRRDRGRPRHRGRVGPADVAVRLLPATPGRDDRAPAVVARHADRLPLPAAAARHPADRAETRAHPRLPPPLQRAHRGLHRAARAARRQGRARRREPLSPAQRVHAPRRATQAALRLPDQRRPGRRAPGVAPRQQQLQKLAPAGRPEDVEALHGFILNNVRHGVAAATWSAWWPPPGCSRCSATAWSATWTPRLNGDEPPQSNINDARYRIGDVAVNEGAWHVMHFRP